MVKHKHTPGPWVANGKYVSTAGTCDTFSGAVWGTIVVCEETDQQDQEGRSWATGGGALENARLIAAAPDLLAAIEALVSSLSEQDEEGLIEHADQMIAAQAAIAKATGEATA